MAEEKKVETGFTVSEEDGKKVKEWITKHRKEKHSDMFRDGMFYSGAIGGGLTYEFMPTSLGTTFVASCHCGEELNLTDYASW